MMLLRASSKSMPVVSASICAIRGMQAVLPSSGGKSSTVKNGSACCTAEEAAEDAAEDAGCSAAEEAMLPEGASVPLQAVSTPAAEQAASPRRKLRREILVFFIRKPS